MKKIILSFDYELFFGKNSGTVFHSIIEPTNKLLDLMESKGFRGNFFVDYLMLRELEKISEERARRDLQMLKNQIQDIVKRGHRVELHLHPHWIDARYNGDGTWDFSDFSHYRLSTLDEDTIVAMFKEGAGYLNQLAGEVIAGYKVIAFRAGGWAVQPFDMLKKGFEASGIKIDSSASFGIFSEKENQEYDFRTMPNRSCYRFSYDVCKEDENGCFLEVPITSYHRNIVMATIDRLYGLFFHAFDRQSDGTHDRQTDNRANKQSTIIKLKKNLKHKLMFTFSYQSPLTVIHALLSHTHQDYYCYIDHPKDFSKSTIISIKRLGDYCESVNYYDFLK